MSSESPVVEIYSSDGYELSVQNNVVTPTNTRGILVAGSDGTNTRFILVDGSARQIVVGAGTAGTPVGGVVTIQGITGGTPIIGNITQFGGTNISTGTGVGGAGIPRVTVSNDSNILATQSGSWTVNTNTPSCSIYKLLSAASTNASNIKGSAGNIYGWSIQNSTTSTRYVKLYNKASAPTVGTDTPVMTLLIPGATAGAGNNLSTTNIIFSIGIALATTVNPSDSDSTAVSLNDLIINIFYV